MKVIYKFLYLPQNHNPEGGVPKNYNVARSIIYSIKNNRLHSNVTISVNGVSQSINQSNFGILQSAHGSWIVDMAEPLSNNYAFVPVPSKEDLVNSQIGTSASRFLACLPDADKQKILDILRFTERLPKASQGGPRHADEVYPKLVVTQNATVGCPDIILLDDIVTSGGHLRACRQRLVEAGYNVVGAIVCGRTVYSIDQNPYEASSFEIHDAFNIVPDFNF